MAVVSEGMLTFAGRPRQLTFATSERRVVCEALLTLLTLNATGFPVNYS